MTTEQEQLKPCPCCGSVNLKSRNSQEYSHHDFGFVKCCDCLISGSYKAWNTRAALANVQAKELVWTHYSGDQVYQSDGKEGSYVINYAADTDVILIYPDGTSISRENVGFAQDAAQKYRQALLESMVQS